jgi:hypothetical protein
MPKCIDLGLNELSFTVNMNLVIKPHWGPPTLFSVGRALYLVTETDHSLLQAIPLFPHMPSWCTAEMSIGMTYYMKNEHITVFMYNYKVSDCVCERERE